MLNARLAYREVAFDDEFRPKKQDSCGDDFADELHRLARCVIKADHPEACRYITRKLLFPAALHLRLDGHGLERFHAGHAFD